MGRYMGSMELVLRLSCLGQPLLTHLDSILKVLFQRLDSNIMPVLPLIPTRFLISSLQIDYAITHTAHDVF